MLHEAAVLLLALAAWGNGQVMEFAGNTPCDAQPRRFLGIAATAACERISWRLTLTPAATGAAAVFTLRTVHGIQAQSAPGFVDGGTTIDHRGTWTTRPGPSAHPEATVYRLETETPRRAMDLMTIGPNLLHPLSDDSTLMVGNAGWSYTLNRTTLLAQEPIVVRRGTGLASRAPRVFEGRTPCREAARRVRVEPAPDCTKIKWRLTLETQPTTTTPGRYKLEGFRFRNPPRTGTWTIEATADPTRVVYRLDPDPNGGFLSFLVLEDSLLFFLDSRGALLVGDEFYSYTLNRIS